MEVFLRLLIFALIPLVLALFCFRLPAKNRRKITGYCAGIIPALIMLLAWTKAFLLIFVWPAVVAFQIIFLSYWTFRHYGDKKIGASLSALLSLGVFWLVMQPWIKDWTFDKQDVTRILS